MKKCLTFRHMDHSPVLENYVNDQLAKLEESLAKEPTPIYLEIVLEADARRSISKAEIRLKTPNYDLISNYQAPDMYDVIDRVIDVMYKKVHDKKKERLDDRRKADSYKGA